MMAEINKIEIDGVTYDISKNEIIIGYIFDDREFFNRYDEIYIDGELYTKEIPNLYIYKSFTKQETSPMAPKILQLNQRLTNISNGTIIIDQLFNFYGENENAILPYGTFYIYINGIPVPIINKEITKALKNIINGDKSVLSFNGRVGKVAPLDGDYTATQITYNDNISVKDKIDTIESAIPNDLQSLISSMQDEINALKNKCPYEVGDSLITTSATNPSKRYPNTTWKQEKDRFILAAGNTYKVNATGGSATHNHKLSDNGRAKIRNYGNKLTYMALENETSRPTLLAQAKTEGRELYSFTHNSDAKETSFNYPGIGLYGNTDSNNGLPPYIVKYIWTRTT